MRHNSQQLLARTNSNPAARTGACSWALPSGTRA